jgi:hypothetical protein
MQQRVSNFKPALRAWLERRFRHPALLAFALCLAATAGSAATFTASLDRDTISLGESVTLSLAFADGTPQDVPNPPEIPNLQIAYVGPSSQFSFINGKVSSSVTHNFTVTPRQPGDYNIPALTAQVDRENLSSKPLTLKVLKASAPPPEAIASGSQVAFVKLALPRKEVYVGETFTAQLQIYLSSQVQRYSPPQLRAFPADGFNVLKMLSTQQRRVQIGNGIYTVLPVEVVLKAIKAGPLTLGPVTINLVLNPRDAFDPFGVFGGGGQSKEMALATEIEKVQSLPLPREKMPANFNGAIGSYTMAVTAGPTNVTAGDPITVKIQISGHGSLDALSLPEQSAWRGFKVYSPSSKVELSDQLGLQGTKTFEEIVAPQTHEIKALPPVSFSFFDPDQKAYRTLTQPPIALTVRPGGSVAAPSIITANRSGQDNPPPTQDIVGIKQRLGTLAQIHAPLVQQPLFLALQGVPVLAFVFAFVWRQRTEKLANNPRLRRRRQVAQLIREGLTDLRRLANEKRSDDFFATLVRLLQEQLGERLDLPASAITEAVVDERLRPRGVPETSLTSLQELFQTCNLARYAPLKTTQELAALVPKLQVLLHELQEMKL